MRRRPAIAALAGALLLTLSVGFLAIVLLWRHAQDERARAEADYRAARDGLTVIVELGRWAFGLERDGLETKEIPNEHFSRCLEVARSHLFELAKPPTSDPEIWKLLAIADLVLGKTLDLRGKPIEAHAFHADAVTNWEKILQEDPHNLFAQHHRWESLIPLARFAERQGNDEESVRRWERTIIVGESMMPFMLDRELCDLAECRMSFSRLVDRLGDHERAWLILEGNLRMRGNVRAETNPTIVRDVESSTREHLCRLWESLLPLARFAERQGDAEESVRRWERAITMGESMMPFMFDRELCDLAECRMSFSRLVDRLGDHERAWLILEGNLRMRGNVRAETNPATVRDLETRTREQLCRLMERFPPPEFEGLAAEDWARRVATRLCLTASAYGTDPTLESERVYRLIESLGNRAASERHISRLDDARRTADRIHALAKLMVARYPDQSAAHLSLGTAFFQRAKNAWRLEDRGAVERYWELALAEARQALFLDPHNALASRDVTLVQRRLDGLRNPQRDK